MFKPNQLIPEYSEVQEARKVKPYSIEKIGGPEEYAKWQKDKAEFEAKWQQEFLKREAAKRLKAHKLVADQTPMTFTDAEKEELAYRQTRDDDDYFEYKPRHTAGKWDAQNSKAKEWAEYGLVTSDEYLHGKKRSFVEVTKDILIKFISGAFNK